MGRVFTKVRVNSKYFYDPVPIDRFNPPYGVQAGLLNPGDQVKVVNLHGAPKANTMGHCYIEKDGKFCGMVHVNSLKKERDTEQ